MLMNNRNQIVTSKKERLHWLDYSKTIGMYLVVLGHVLKDNAQLFKVVIYSFHMPLFFFLSGFLHKLKIGRGKYFLSILKQLVIPFLIFNGLTFITKIKDIPIDGVFVVTCDFLKELGESIYLGELPIGPSWFILSLIWMKIIMFFLLRIRSDFRSLSIVGITWVIVLAVFYTSNFPKIPNYFHLGSSLLSFPFYIAGYLLKLKYKDSVAWLKKRYWMISLIFALYLVGLSFNGFTSLEGCVVGNHVLFMYLSGICGTLLVVISTHLLKNQNKWVYILSCGTIVILCTHGFLLNTTINKYPLFELYSVEWYSYAIIGCLVIMLIEIPVILFCSRYFKWAIGGRKIVVD